MNRIPLSGTWNLTGKKNCQAKIPGDFHSALLEAGMIENPYYGFNEQDILWVGQSDWTISRDFNFSKTKGEKQYLVLTEADTFFTVYINGKQAGKGQNQFTRYRFDITDLLQDGKNTIKFDFESAEKKCLELEKQLPYPVPYMKYDVYSPARNLARKCQCHGGWDWGPCIMVSGIYGDIYIESTPTGYIESSTITWSFGQKKNNQYENCTANITLNFYAIDDFAGTAEFSITKKGEKALETIKLPVKLKKGSNTINAQVMVEKPELWKTAGELKEEGLSENIAYDFTASVNAKRTKVSQTKKICIHNFKAVSLKDFEEGKDGRSLYFENDGRKIFSKGSNWIPADSLPSRMTEERYIDLLNSTVQANQNTLRVWGGGIYEKDIFYELCDKLGIIVWQDCMFACSTYPMNEEFIKEVENELDYQVPRLQSHACIGLWCGNNENFGALNWFKECNENRVRYLVDYDRLYNGVIGTKIKKLDPQRLYWPSSPCSGPDDFADNWHADNMGDMHYWSVWHERKPFEAYLSIRPRFVSEFGYESFPSMECIKSFAEEKDFSFTSRLMEYHQRSPSGNSIMIENFARYFKFPVGFENMVYLSQVQQAVAIRMAVDWWRSLRPHCMGTIIWQLNDVWPGPSWSSLEYSGKWKLLHYESRKFFSNVYMPLFIKDDILTCNLCNDTKDNLKVELQINYLKFDGSQYKKSQKLNCEIKADTAISLYTEEIPKADRDKYFIYATATAKTTVGKTYTTENTVFPSLYKHSEIKPSNLKWQVSKKDSKTALITLKSENPAFFVSLDAEGIKGNFSNNMFTLPDSTEKTVEFNAEQIINISKLKKSLKVLDLSKSY